MSQLRMKGQALALVLIVVVVAIIVAFAISSRVIQDTVQQGEERASSRAETLADSSIDNLTLQLQGGQIDHVSGNTQTYSVGTTATEGAVGTLDLCSADSQDPERQCDDSSSVKVSFYKNILQFKYFDAENLEVFMSPEDKTTSVNSTDSGIIIYLDPNESYNPAKSMLLIKGFTRNDGSNTVKELSPVSECLINLNSSTGSCLPDYLVVSKRANCPTFKVTTINGTSQQFPTNEDLPNTTCIEVRLTEAGKAKYPIDLYRIRPILCKPGATNCNNTSGEIPYLSISVSSNDTTSQTKELPEYHMAMLNAGVYSGTAGSAQQVFQQKTRLVLLHKTVPEIADYVLYNGSTKPIVKK